MKSPTNPEAPETADEPATRSVGEDGKAARSLGDLLASATRTLGDSIEARREAIALCAALLGGNRAALLLRLDEPASPALAERIAAASVRRAGGEPLAYIVGYRGFWTHDIHVTRDVLVPRPETEGLVERALALGDALADTAAARPSGMGRASSPAAHPIEVLDLGTGSGCIAISLASERPAWRVHASDRSDAALSVARGNAARLVPGRIAFALGDWLGCWPARRFDLIVGNPPYVADDDPHLQGDGVRHEPRPALTPGPDAMAAIREIVRAAPRALKTPGALVLEHGSTQAAEVAALLVAQGFAHVTSRPDLAGLPRCTEGHWLR